jgi:GNAT superfamily N-acetyltransferase
MPGTGLSANFCASSCGSSIIARRRITWPSEPNPPRPLDIFMRDAGGAIVGGITAATFWGWLDVDTLWVSEELRGRGFGARLLAEAEAEARRRGCRHARLDTYSFQARGFYAKQGYRVVGEMVDFPPGSTFYWLRKDLDA